MIASSWGCLQAAEGVGVWEVWGGVTCHVRHWFQLPPMRSCQSASVGHSIVHGLEMAGHA
jgi:hypothetical protein